ncbi:MAG: DUF448 domain-containing protein [Armatimonadota bacterium]
MHRSRPGGEVVANHPVRTCSLCRSKGPQGSLLRLRISSEGDLQTSSIGTGRSAYICETCRQTLMNGGAKVVGALSRALKRPVTNDQLTALSPNILCQQR